MSSKTRIIVLHMKEIIYTAVFLALAVVLAVIHFFMFGPGKAGSHTAGDKSRYNPGVYSSSITLNDNTFDVEVTVNADKIKAIRLVNLSETSNASYPLMEPVLISLATSLRWSPVSLTACSLASPDSLVIGWLPPSISIILGGLVISAKQI